jgi:hypothetical protein
VSVAVTLDGEHDMTMRPSRVMADFESIMETVMGHAAPWSATELRDISTVTFARPDVSVLTVHGAGDDNVYVAQGDRITAALRSVVRTPSSFASRATRATATRTAGVSTGRGRRSIASWIESSRTTATRSTRRGTAGDRR